MARLAEITSGVVTNIITGTTEDWPTYIPLGGANNAVQIGWLYDGEVFSPPPAPPTPTPQPTSIPPQYLLRLFTKAEKMAIMTALNASTYDAELGMYFTLFTNATSIRSDNEDLEDGLDYLETEGLIGTGRAEEIIDDIEAID